DHDPSAPDPVRKPAQKKREAQRNQPLDGCSRIDRELGESPAVHGEGAAKISRRVCNCKQDLCGKQENQQCGDCCSLISLATFRSGGQNNRRFNGTNPSDDDQDANGSAAFKDSGETEVVG